MGNSACPLYGSARRRGRRGTVSEAQGEPNRNQRQNGDAEIIVHACKIGIQFRDRFAVLSRLDGLAHAFAENRLGDKERLNQPVPTDLVDGMALNVTNPVF